MATTVSFTHASTAPRGRTGRIALWILQIALAGMFLMAGGSKWVGAPAMIALFTDIGIGQWFRYATGLIEVGSALALLRPRLAVFGALALVPTMVGAILAQLFIVHSSPVPPAVLLAGAALVLWARRHELPIPKQPAR
jgi:putative oxidoreductase